MNLLRLSPSRDAGRFAYHLKSLIRADLVKLDAKAKKYSVTDLGRMAINFTEDVERAFSKRRRMMVRTSRLAMETFDRNKIVESLVREAGVPVNLAQKIARETEERLLEFKTRYLTAPLIREIVNAILIEKGLEEYRHKLTRLGLPVYDVTQLVKSMGERSLSVESVHRATGSKVIEEYTLLNVLPRDIADAHLSGALHIKGLGYWILKLDEFMHDLRFFLQHGLNLGRASLVGTSCPPPKSFEAALLMASGLLRVAATEVAGEQLIDFFNVFLAPFVRGLSIERIREGLHLFILTLNQSVTEDGTPVKASLSLELAVPDFLKRKEAIGPGGRKVGYYSDFVEESQLLASLLLEEVFEDDKHKPIFNPSLVVKIRSWSFTSKEGRNLMLQCHKLAAERGTPYFANLLTKTQTCVSYTATGNRVADDWSRDWELDTLRTGSMGSVVINLPRISYDADGSYTRFLRILDERLEMVLRALEIKYLTLKHRVREGLLPILTQKTSGEHYFRIENAPRLVSIIGLNETVQSFLGKDIYADSESLEFAQKLVRYIHRSTRAYSKRPETRTYFSMVSDLDAARRLAELDVERYGWSKVRTQGTKEKPFYTSLVAVPLQADISLDKRLSIEGRFQRLSPGGHLAIIKLADLEQTPDELLSTTERILKNHRVRFYTYSRDLSYCARCQKTFYGDPPKCPACGAVNDLIYFSRVSSKYALRLKGTSSLSMV